MAECERLATCPFFSNRMANMPRVADLMKQTFCHGNSSHCARYQVASAGVTVPSDLYPQDTERARDILQRRL